MPRGRYGQVGRHLEIYDLYESFRDDQAAQQALVDAGVLQEDTGAPEGRADFPIYLQSMIRMVVRERFRGIPPVYEQYLGVVNAQDFRRNVVTELGGITGMRPVPEFGPYARMFSSETRGPSYTVGKHGGVYEITFELIVNDDANRILNRIPRELARHAGEYRSQVIVAFIESNPTYELDGQPFFSATRGNEVTGTAADVSEDNLVSILEFMTQRRDVNNVPFTIDPQRIIVKSPRQALRFQQIIRSSQTIETTAGAVGNTTFARGSDNPLSYNGGIMPADAVIQEPWLNDANDYYVMGNAQDRPGFVIAYFRNQREPFVGLLDPGVRNAFTNANDPYTWDYDTIPYKVRDLFGVAPGEPLAIVRGRPT
jgi:hypothetical protein